MSISSEIQSLLGAAENEGLTFGHKYSHVWGLSRDWLLPEGGEWFFIRKHGGDVIKLGRTYNEARKTLGEVAPKIIKGEL